MQPNSQSKVISVIIAVVVLALIIVGLVWLSDNGAKFGGKEQETTSGPLTDAQVNEILKNLKASADPNAKPLTDAQVDETLKNLKATASPEAKPLTDAQVEETLKNLKNSN